MKKLALGCFGWLNNLKDVGLEVIKRIFEDQYII